MYKKRKKVSKNLTNQTIATLCEEILKYNEDAILATSKRFIEKESGIEEIKDKLPIIYTSEPNIQLPSSLKLLLGKYITNWCDDIPLAILEYKQMSFKDGEINDKLIKNLYLTIK